MVTKEKGRDFSCGVGCLNDENPLLAIDLVPRWRIYEVPPGLDEIFVS